MLIKEAVFVVKEEINYIIDLATTNNYLKINPRRLYQRVLKNKILRIKEVEIIYHACK